jgi:pimeloyl-ACP methyl ester carboxylesterase
MPTAVVNRCRFYYEVSGRGPTVVFLHGENHNLDMFADQVRALSDRYQCLAYARRGHMKTEATPYGYSLHHQVLDLGGILDALGVERVVLVAVAMSTPIATSYALGHPERVRGLVLVSWYELDGYPAAEGRRRGTHPITFPELNLLLDEAQRSGGTPAVAEFIDRESSRLFPIFPTEPTIRQRLIRMFADHPAGRYIHAAEYYTSLPNLVAELPRLKCPILGICGQDDPSPDRPELVSGMPNFRQEWIPRARRFTLMEEPATFNGLLSNFLDAVGLTAVNTARDG